MMELSADFADYADLVVYDDDRRFSESTLVKCQAAGRLRNLRNLRMSFEGHAA
jgi:hypothetical protein